jgi:hypothetical protein
MQRTLLRSLPMEDHPEPTESEDELAATERHQEEEAMRGAEHHEPPAVESDEGDDDR